MKRLCCSVCIFDKNEPLGCKATQLKWAVEELVMSMPVIGDALYPYGLTKCEWFEQKLQEMPVKEVEMNTNDDMISRGAAKIEIRKLMLEIADTPLVDEYTSKLASKLGELVMKKLDELPDAPEQRKLLQKNQLLERKRAALLAALRQADQDCAFCAGSKVNQEACEAADYGCESCDAICICRACRGNSNWSWCGMREEKDGSNLDNCSCCPSDGDDTGVHLGGE